MFNLARVAEEILQPALPVAVLTSIPFLTDTPQAEHHNDFQQSRKKQDGNA